MVEHESTSASTTEALPVSPSLGPTLDAAQSPRRSSVVGPRVAYVSVVAVLVAFAAGLVAQGLTRLIGLITNLCFYGRISTSFASPAEHRLGYFVVLVPIAGGLLVGLMARYGSQAIRGHGIPEAMEQVLLNRSRIPPRLTLLKPLSAAISIGTGGPFGAEGPIIATGGALGSLVGQILKITADERKTLLAAGAAAGMAATFGSPVSAVLLAVELLLFEYRPRSIIPVALAASAATAVRISFVGPGPVFALPGLTQPGGAALAIYVALGALVGVASVYVTRAVYGIEELFERLPVHWMWWPALGGVVVGLVGLVSPRTMGVGYDNIEQIISGQIAGRALVFLFLLKFVSWSISLGSGTSGGTLAPLFTIGGGLGAALAGGVTALAPSLGVDTRIAGLVGMAAMFAGASHALLASVVFAFETTRQPIGLLPLLGGCTTAYLTSCLMMRHSIMTEKLARRGTPIETGYAADFLAGIRVVDSASAPAVTVLASETLAAARSWLSTGAPGSEHSAFPVVDAAGDLVGLVTRRELVDARAADTLLVGSLVRRPPVVVTEDATLRQAADLMAAHGVGRLPVVRRAAPRKVIGIITPGDLLAAHRRRLHETELEEQGLAVRAPVSPRVRAGAPGEGA